MILDALILAFIMIYGKGASCGIPLMTWIVVFFIAHVLQTISSYIEIIITRLYRNYQAVYSIVSFLILNTFIVIWFIYGNILFYSEENDCYD